LEKQIKLDYSFPEKQRPFFSRFAKLYVFNFIVVGFALFAGNTFWLYLAINFWNYSK
jgi:hypothetical protein